MSCLRLSVWSGPRNVSTALMYAFAQRADTRVYDEPLYAHYLAYTGLEHPGRDEVLASQDSDGERVVRRVLLEPCRRPLHFFKNMAHHLQGLDRTFLAELRHVLLTRDPGEMLPSLAKQLPEPTLADTGYVQQIELLEWLLAAGETPLVLESKRLLQDPEGMLERLCERLGISFDPAMLSWPRGPKPFDGVWAEHWYRNVHDSSGFLPYEAKETPFPARLESLLSECRPLYERLGRYAIRPD